MKRLLAKDWLGSAAGILVLWLVLSIASSQFSLASLTGILISAAFLAIVAIGQAFTITTGRANIDLSVGSMVTLGAFITTRFSSGSALDILLAVIAALVVGLLCGAVNGALVAVLGLPAIIVTLGVGYLLETVAQLLNSGMNPMAQFGWLTYIATGWIGAVPVICGLAVVVTTLVAVCLERTAFGQGIIAIGQSHRAAALAGIRVRLLTIICFMISSGLSALVGSLLAARSGGAFLDMGNAYLIQSIGAVVIGGTAIGGGRTTFVGALLGSVLLVLLVTTMQVLRLVIGVQELIEGLIITVILVLPNLIAWMRRMAGSRPVAQSVKG